MPSRKNSSVLLRELSNVANVMLRDQCKQGLPSQHDNQILASQKLHVRKDNI